MNFAPITVVIPARNRATLLKTALASVREQTLSPQEIIVVDDGSSDATAAVAEQGGATVIRLHQGLGISTARNIGILAASQPWIAFLDSDDRWERDKLSRQWNVLQTSETQADMVFSDFSVSMEDTTLHQSVLYPVHAKEVGHSIDPHFLDIRAAYAEVVKELQTPGVARCTPESLQRALVRYGGFILTSSLLLRRDLFLRIGLFNMALDVGQDWDLFLRLSLAAKAIVIEEPLVCYRLHAANNSGDFARAMTFLATLIQNGRSHPERYPAGFEEYWKAELPRRLDLAMTSSLSQGDFSRTKQLLLQKLQWRTSATTLGLLACISLADSHFGHTIYYIAKQIKRLLQSKHQLTTP